MFTLVATVHIVVALVMILLVLVQDSKGGAGMFAGGSSQSILGATGGANLLTKLTRAAAVLFAITSIMLTIYTAKQSESVIDKEAVPLTAPQSAPPVEDGATSDKTK